MSTVKTIAPTQFVPRLTGDEVETLLIAICRSREVRAEATRLVEPEYFGPADGACAPLFSAVRKIAPRFDDGDEIPYLDLRTAASEEAGSLGYGPGMDPWEDLFAVPGAGQDRVGLLHHAYREVGPGDFSAREALGLLRRFLQERAIHAPIRARMLAVPEGYTADFGPTFAAHRDLMAEIDAIGEPGLAGAAVGARWAAHEEAVDRDRGRALLGLRTGVPGLDGRTLGLRGIMLVGARPGGGKTALAVHAAVGACRHREDNDAVCLFVSLEMDADKILSRIKCHVAGLDWATYRRGSADRSSWVAGAKFDREDLARIEEGGRRMRLWELERRLYVLDRATLGRSWTARRLIRMAEEAKAAAGAARALVIIDHLQYVPAAPAGRDERRSDIDADRLRMGVVKDVARGLKTAEDPDPAIFLIAQSRKPPTSKDEWGTTLSEFLGSAETAFAADEGLLLHYMTPAEVRDYYGPDTGPGGRRGGSARSKPTRGTGR